MASGKAKPEHPAQPVGDDEQPHDLPAGWVWCRVTDTGQYINGLAFKPTDWGTTGRPIIRIQNLSGRSPDFNRTKKEVDSSVVVKDGDILVSWSATLDTFIWRGEEGVLNQHIFRVTPSKLIAKSFLFWLLKGVIQELAESDHAHGLVMNHINRGPFLAHVVGIPPLAEQHRIVARVEELMKLCDALEQSGRLADEQHARLTSTLFDTLAASESAHALAENWQCIAEHFDLLLDRPEAIDALERTILALAIQGRLVPQDSTEDSAAPSSQLPIGATAMPIDEGELPFEIPPGWQWIRLGWAAELINGDRGTNYPNRAEYVASGLPFINTGHIEPDGTLSQESMHYLTRKKFDSLRSGKTRPGDLVYCLRGATLGKTAVVHYAEGAIASSLVIIRLNEAVDWKYAYYFLIGPLGRDLIKRFDNGSAQPNLAANSVKRYVMPLPPIAEQRRIVARVEELRRLCAGLRQRITLAREIQSRLADALVAEIA
jgi:type I restriction enzyme S subunit